MADEAQDVKEVVEETTVEEPSTQEETTVDNEVDDSGVPVKNRLAEMQRKYGQLEEKYATLESRLSPKEEIKPSNPQEEVVKQQLDKMLKDLGYVSQKDLEVKEADRALAENIKSLETKYDGKNGLPRFDRAKVLAYAQENLIGNVELAYKSMNEAAIMDARIKEALGKTKGVKTEVSDGSGSNNVGTTDDDLRSAAQSGDRGAMQTLLKRVIS